MSIKGKPKTAIVALLPIIIIVYFAMVYCVHFKVTKFGGVNAEYLQEIGNAKEYLWRILWGVSSIALVLVITASVVVSTYIIYNNLREVSKPKNYLVSFLSMLIILVIVECFYVGIFKTTGVSGGGGKSQLVMIESKLNIEVITIIRFTMMSSTIALFLIAVSLSSILIRPEISSVELITKKWHNLQQAFHATSLFLCIAILQISCLFWWSAHVDGLHEATRTVAKALSIGGGVTFTIIFGLLFAPVSIALNFRMKELAIEQEAGTPKKYKAWKKDQGFDRTAKGDIGHIFILFAPLIIGIATTLINKLNF